MSKLAKKYRIFKRNTFYFNDDTLVRLSFNHGLAFSWKRVELLPDALRNSGHKSDGIQIQVVAQDLGKLLW